MGQGKKIDANSSKRGKSEAEQRRFTNRKDYLTGEGCPCAIKSKTAD
jgi:hypothetical protein